MLPYILVVIVTRRSGRTGENAATERGCRVLSTTGRRRRARENFHRCDPRATGEGIDDDNIRFGSNGRFAEVLQFFFVSSTLYTTCARLVCPRGQRLDGITLAAARVMYNSRTAPRGPKSQ